MPRRSFRKTNIAAPRIPETLARSATLNVRATPEQYARWRRFADYAGLSLSRWVADHLDELVGARPRILGELDTFGRRH